MNLNHLSYLQQVSDLIEDDHKSLAAHYGYIAKKIASKNVIHLSGIDPSRLRHCAACQAPITSRDLKNDKGKLNVKCTLCGLKRSYPIAKKQERKQK